MTSKEKISSAHGSITPRRLRSGTPLGISLGCRFTAEKMSGKLSTSHSKKDVGAKTSSRISDCKTQDNKKLSETKERDKGVTCDVVGSKRKSLERYPQKIAKGTLPSKNPRKMCKCTLPKENPRKVLKVTLTKENPRKEILKQNVSDGRSSSKSKVPKRTKLQDLLKKSDKQNALQKMKGKSGHSFHRSLSPAESFKSILKKSVKKRPHKILESSPEVASVKPKCSLASDGAKPRNPDEHKKEDISSLNRRPTAFEILQMPDDYWVMRKHYLGKGKSNSPSFTSKTVKILSEEGCSSLHSDCHLQDRDDSYSQLSPRLLSKESSQENGKADIGMSVKPRSTSLASPSCGKAKTLFDSRADNQTNQECVDALGHAKSSFSDSKANDVKSEIRVFFGESSTGDTSSNRVTGNACDQSRYEHRYNGCRQTDLLGRGQSCHGYESVTDVKICFQGSDLSDPRDEPVLEESILPPVANTVELLTEPCSVHHDDHHHHDDCDNDDERDRIHAYSPAYHSPPGSCRAEGGHNSPGPPVVDPLVTCKSEPVDETVEPACLQIAQQPREDDGRQKEEDADARGEQREVGGENSKKGESKQRTAELEENHGEAVACGLGTEASDVADRKGQVCGANSRSYLDDSGARRRRKTRPSRRSKTQCRWLAGGSGVSPGDETSPSGGGVNRDAASPHLPGDKGRLPTEGSGRKSMGKRQGKTTSCGRRSRKGVEVETLWANPELDTHAFLLWASENRHEMQKRHPTASSGEVEHLLAQQWSEVAFAGKVHFLCRARDASTDQDIHAVRKTKAHAEKKDAPSADGSSVYKQFLALPVDRQRDLLRKWLKFFQQMLPRGEYQEFINDFKKACKSLQLRPVSARRKNARLRNLDPSHYHMLFEKIRLARPRVISLYNKRKVREDRLLCQSFHALVRRLVLGQPWSFVRGCRSKVLGELLKDIQQLEVEEALAQIDPPFSFTPSEVQDVLGHDPSTLPLHPSPAASTPLSGSKDLFDDVRASSPSVTAPSAADHDGVISSTNSSNNNYKSSSGMDSSGNNISVSQVSRDATVAARAGQTSPGRSILCSSNNCTNSIINTSSREQLAGPELPESALVLSLLDGLQYATDLPVLDQRCLDAVFLGPPPRIRLTVHSRDGQQFQHTPTPASSTASSAASAYRRTLMYKHIHPLPLGLSPLYHGRPPRFFFQ